MYGVAVFGDSIVFGRGDGKHRGWCGRLKKAFEQEEYYNTFYNLGIPGETSTGIVKRIKIECESRLQKIREGDKTLIIIAIGVNDSRYIGKNDEPQTTKQQFKEDLTTISNIAKQWGDRVIFIGLTPVNQETRFEYEGTQFSNKRILEFQEIVKDNCQKESFQFINVFDAMIKENLSEILDDGLHPNEKGYEFMYNIISKEIQF